MGEQGLGRLPACCLWRSTCDFSCAALTERGSPLGIHFPGRGGDTAHGPEIQVSRMPALLGDAHVCKEKMAMTFFYVLIQRQGAHGSGGRGEGERESGVEREIMA